jgi:uncharacterized protein YdeI (YjbR/CyaY-like superfamily)
MIVVDSYCLQNALKMRIMQPVFFKDVVAFRKWLKKNHAKKKEVWVGYWKIHTGKPSMTWSESVEQALCFGWIDGIRKSIDAESYTNRFTPRRPGSNWSAINIAKVEVLSKKGLMEPAGIAAFEKRKGEKGEVYSYENKPVNLTTTYQKLFRANKAAWKFFKEQAPSYQRTMIYWIMAAKHEATRMKRLIKTIETSAEARRVL